MPTYMFRDNKKKIEYEQFMGIKEADDFLAANPHIHKIPAYTPGFGDPIRLGIRRHDNGFNDVLKKIKKGHPLGNLQTR